MLLLKVETTVVDSNCDIVFQNPIGKQLLVTTSLPKVLELEPS